MLKATKNGTVSNFQRLSNSADFRKNVNKAYKTEDFLFGGDCRKILPEFFHQFMLTNLIPPDEFSADCPSVLHRGLCITASIYKKPDGRAKQRAAAL